HSSYYGLPVPSYFAQPPATYGSRLANASISSYSNSNTAVSKPVEFIKSLSPQQLSKSIKRSAYEGSSIRRHLEKELWKHYSKRAMAVIEEFSLQDIIMILKACAFEKIDDFSLFYALCDQSLILIESPSSAPLSATSLHSFVVSCGKLHLRDTKILNAFILLIYKDIHSFNSKQIASLIHAYSKLHHYNEKFFYFIADILPPYFNTLSSTLLSNLCTTYANSKFYKKSFFDALVIEATSKLSLFTVMELKNFVMGLSLLSSLLPSHYQRTEDYSFLCKALVIFHRTAYILSFHDILLLIEAFLSLNFNETNLSEHILLLSLSQKYLLLEKKKKTMLISLRLLRVAKQFSVENQPIRQLLENVLITLPSIISSSRSNWIVEVLISLVELQCVDLEVFSKCEAFLISNGSAFHSLSLEEIEKCKNAFKMCEPLSQWDEILDLLEIHKQIKEKNYNQKMKNEVENNNEEEINVKQPIHPPLGRLIVHHYK
ncbi:hypothetical protein IE077_003185, partial [Cardiosporidium cionae]